jgi:dihydrodipicolinate synthase/N-acetylneuraminate lyase
MLTRENLNGVWAGVPTPWTSTGDFDDEAFADNVARLCAAGVHGVYTTGTTGEFYSLTEDEFRRMVKAFADATRGTGVPTQVGCTWADTRGCIWRAQIAADHGVDGLQASLPFWSRMNDDEVVQFFADLSRACPGLPIVHYNNPNSKRSLDARLYQRVAAEVPALIGTKQVTTDLNTLIELFVGVPELNHFASDWLLAPFMMLGAKGTYSALALFNPKLTLDWYGKCVRGEWAAALEIQRQVLRLIVEVDNRVTEMGYGGPASDKAWAGLAGFLKGSRAVRPPYKTIPDDVVEILRQGILERMPEMITPDLGGVNIG